MTDRSTFDAFEQRLARDLAHYVAPAVDTRAASQIADAAMQPRTVSIRARNASSRRLMLLLAVAAALILPTAWLVAGGASPRLTSSPDAAHPMVEDLGPWTGGPPDGLASAVLADGRVLLAGGAATGSAPANAWLFDPASKRLEAAGVMTDGLTTPMMVAIPGDRVLMLGGSVPADGQTDSRALDQSAELYDGAAGTFAPAPSLPSARRDCACGALDRLPWAVAHATSLLDGRVVVAGGDRIAGSPVGSDVADVYDPIASSWSQVDIGCQADRSTQVRLADGRLLVICVSAATTPGGPATVRARAFDPATNAFSDVGTPPAPSRSGTLLIDGRVLFTGFAPFIYDPATKAFEGLPSGPHPRGGRPGIALANGGALFLGDSGTRPMRFVAATGQFRELLEPGLVSDGVAVALRDGRVLAIDDRGVRLVDPSQLP